MTTNDDPDIGSAALALAKEKEGEEFSRFSRRKQLRALNLNPSVQGQCDPCVLLLFSVLN